MLSLVALSFNFSVIRCDSKISFLLSREKSGATQIDCSMLSALDGLEQSISRMNDDAAGAAVKLPAAQSPAYSIPSKQKTRLGRPRSQRPVESFKCRCISHGKPCMQSFARKAQRYVLWSHRPCPSPTLPSDEHIENVHGLIPCIHQMCGRGFDTHATMMSHMRSESDHIHLVCRVCGEYVSPN